MDVLEGQGCRFHNQGESKPWRQSLRGQQRILKGGAFVDVPEDSHSERQNRIRRIKMHPEGFSRGCKSHPEGQSRTWEGRSGRSKSYPGRIRSLNIASCWSKCIPRAVPEGKNRIRNLKVVPGRVLSEGQNRIREVRGVPVRIKIKPGGPKSRPGRKQQKH